MINSTPRRNRRSIRLQGYDYSQTGAYFVTICTQSQACLFGEIVGNEMRLNAAGQMVCRWYQELEKKFANIKCDAFVCMPNHVHFIVVNAGTNVGADLRVCPDLRVRPKSVQQQNGQTHRSAPTEIREPMPLYGSDGWMV